MRGGKLSLREGDDMCRARTQTRVCGLQNRSSWAGDPREVATGLGKPPTALGREMETMPPSSPRPPALNPSLWAWELGQTNQIYKAQPLFDCLI